MFGLIVKFITKSGQRDEFIRMMSEGFQDLNGCHSYILAADASDDTSVWITEIWESEESHDVSLHQQRILDVVARAKPLIESRELRIVTEPRGGQGL